MNPTITVYSTSYDPSREERDARLFAFWHEDPNLATPGARNILTDTQAAKQALITIPTITNIDDREAFTPVPSGQANSVLYLTKEHVNASTNTATPTPSDYAAATEAAITYLNDRLTGKAGRDICLDLTWHPEGSPDPYTETFGPFDNKLVLLNHLLTRCITQIPALKNLNPYEAVNKARQNPGTAISLTTPDAINSPETPPMLTPDDLPTRQFVDLSTTHITKKDADLLKNSAHNPSSPVMPWSSTYGHLVFIPDDIETIRNNEDWPFSDDFWNTLTYINDCGINYILFDRDAEIIPGLPTHSW